MVSNVANQHPEVGVLVLRERNEIVFNWKCHLWFVVKGTLVPFLRRPVRGICNCVALSKRGHNIEITGIAAGVTALVLDDDVFCNFPDADSAFRSFSAGLAAILGSNLDISRQDWNNAVAATLPIAQARWRAYKKVEAAASLPVITPSQVRYIVLARAIGQCLKGSGWDVEYNPGYTQTWLGEDCNDFLDCRCGNLSLRIGVPDVTQQWFRDNGSLRAYFRYEVLYRLQSAASARPIELGQLYEALERALES